MKKTSSPRAGVPARDDRGFTLVELIVAIVILAIVFIPLLHAFVTGAQTETKSRIQNNATTAAQSLVENIQSQKSADFRTNYVINKTSPIAGTASAGGSTFDTRVSVSTTGTDNNVTNINSKPISVGNRTDVMVDMTGADEDALAEFAALTNGHYASTDTALRNALNRTIGIKSELQKDGIYTVTVTFAYTGSISYIETTVDPKTNKTTATSVPVNFSSSAVDKETIAAPDSATTAQLKTAGKAAYSMYLFFAPILHESKTYYSDTFTIENTEAKGVKPNGLDFNVFLVDIKEGTTDGTSATNYRPSITYDVQNSKTQTRVFSNVKMSSGSSFLRQYTAKFVDGGQRSFSIDGTLVEKQQVDRAYSVTVQIFKQGDTANPLVTFNTVKLC